MLGREQSPAGFTTLVGAATYSFSPASSNTVAIPVAATTADLAMVNRLSRPSRRADTVTSP